MNFRTRLGSIALIFAAIGVFAVALVHAHSSAQVASVEVGYTEQSPRGDAGGLAVPASSESRTGVPITPTQQCSPDNTKVIVSFDKSNLQPARDNSGTLVVDGRTIYSGSPSTLPVSVSVDPGSTGHQCTYTVHSIEYIGYPHGDCCYAQSITTYHNCDFDAISCGAPIEPKPHIRFREVDSNGNPSSWQEDKNFTMTEGNRLEVGWSSENAKSCWSNNKHNFSTNSIAPIYPNDWGTDSDVDEPTPSTPYAFKVTCGDGNGNNNSITRTVFAQSAPMPDLAPSNVTVGGDLTPGGTVDFTSTISNIGTKDSGDYPYVFQISKTDQSWDGYKAIYANSGGLGQGQSIAAGGSHNETRSWNNAVKGTYYVRISVDQNNIITESNETNNISDWTPFEVKDSGTPTGPTPDPVHLDSVDTGACDTTEIKLKWTDNNTVQVDGYLVRYWDSVNKKWVSENAGKVHEYTLVLPAANTSYIFAVQAYNSAGVSLNSNTRSGTTPDACPGGGGGGNPTLTGPYFVKQGQPFTLDYDTDGGTCNLDGPGLSMDPVPLKKGSTDLITIQNDSTYILDCGADGSKPWTVHALPANWES